MRIALITNIPNPYRVPLFNRLAGKLAVRGDKLKVFFGAWSYPRRRWAVDPADLTFPYEVLRSRQVPLGSSEHTLFTYRGLLRELRAFDSDVVIAPGFSLATIKALLWTRARDRPLIIWSGTIEGAYRSRARLWQRKLLASFAAGFVAYGTKAREYLLSLGVAAERVHIATNTVDTSFFAAETERRRVARSIDQERKSLLYVGQLSPRKNVARLLPVLRELRKQRSDFCLDIVGEGAERSNLQALVREQGLEEHVVFHGFQPKESLPLFLSRSVCFLFQTDFDIWGLVLNEAMAAGVPCLASDRAGATHDLILEGETGFCVDFSDAKKVASLINRLLSDPHLREQMGKKGADLIAERASLDASVTGFIHAIESVLNPGQSLTVRSILQA